MKEMTSVATTMMTEEEKAELERDMNSGASTPPQSSVTESPASPTAGPSEGATATATPTSPHPQRTEASSATSTALTPSPLPSPGEGQGDEKHLQAKGAKEKKRNKLTPEQKQKLHDLEVERRKNMEERVETLSKKLIDRLRPFVEAKNPGAADDPETKSFEEKMRREADDLKLESFGVEVRIFCVGSIDSALTLCSFCILSATYTL